ncbi:MAG TPA: amidohydrolase family protein [Streptosporangiaceae bacterium]|jgi:2,3-dihydroxybenzoate decarboxylase|nr:amidohydrolase family protein [Streptosporangiaceae bacterium]
MRYVALEEAFTIPDLPALSSALNSVITHGRKDFVESIGRKLPDFTQWRIPEMDEAGVEVQVLSHTVPGIQQDLETADAAKLARAANDYLADIVAQHPSRFAGFAALPLQDPGAAVAELTRAVQELGFSGALVNDYIAGHYLDEPRFDELWSALESLGVPLYLHPGIPPTEQWALLGGHPELSGALWSWQATAGGHAMRIVMGGVFDRHPGATLILGHMGEFLPFQTSRFDSRYATLNLDQPLHRRPSEYFGRNVVITTS